MSRWMIPTFLLAAPVLILALAGWAVAFLLRRIGAAIAPRPEGSEWDFVADRAHGGLRCTPHCPGPGSGRRSGGRSPMPQPQASQTPGWPIELKGARPMNRISLTQHLRALEALAIGWPESRN